MSLLLFEDRIQEIIRETQYDCYCNNLPYYPRKPYKWDRIKELKKLNWHEYQSTTKLNTTYIIGFNKNKEVKHFMIINRVRNKEHFSFLDDDGMGMFDFMLMMNADAPYYYSQYNEEEDNDAYSDEIYCMFLLPPLIDLGKIRFRHLPKCLKRQEKYYYESMIIDNPNQKRLPRKLINDYFADKI